MAANDTYVHDLSPMIFEVSKLPLEWMATPVGIAGLVGFAVVGFALTWLLAKKAKEQGKESGLPNTLRIGGALLLIVLLALFSLKKFGIDWGLRWYSTMYLLGFFYGYMCFRNWIARRQAMMTPLLLDSLVAHVIVGMIAGARIAYVFIYNWDAYKNAPADLLKVWEGGLSFHGGIVGVVTALFIFSKRNGIPFWHIADRVSLTVPFGIAVGRIGNFMNGELYGRVIGSDVPWAVVFPSGGPQPRHPSQIYQSLGEGWLLLLTLFLINRRGRGRYHEGTIAVAFIGFYGLYRYFMEFFREADEQLKYYFNNTTTMGQILCGLTILVAVSLYFVKVRNNAIVGSTAWQSGVDDFLKRRTEIENG